MTRFEVLSSYLANYDVQEADRSAHLQYWIPAGRWMHLMPPSWAKSKLFKSFADQCDDGQIGRAFFLANGGMKLMWPGKDCA